MKYIAVYNRFAGLGKDPNAAVDDLKSKVDDYDGWDDEYLSEVSVYEVGRQGKPQITVSWEEGKN